MCTRALPLFLATVVVLVAGCDGTATAPVTSAAEPDIVFFNPQPEPPGQVYHFMVEDLGTEVGDRSMGTLLHPSEPGAEGTLTIETLAVETSGTVVHLVQSWELIPPAPGVPSDAHLMGILNLANGRLVMNSVPREPGVAAQHQQIAVLGTAEFNGAGIAVEGEVMITPEN